MTDPTSTQICCDDLRPLLYRLSAALPAGSVGFADKVSGSKAPPAPVALGVLDLLAELTWGLNDLTMRVRDSLGFSHSHASSLAGVAEYVHKLPALVEALTDEALAGRVETDLWDWHHKAQSVLGMVPRAHFLERACPHCGGRLLVARDAQSVRCVNRAWHHAYGLDGTWTADDWLAHRVQEGEVA